MGELTFTPLTDELEDLVTFFIENTWEFHRDPHPSKYKIMQSFHKGWYQDERATFWINKNGEKIGLIILDDITDTIPMFDIRLATRWRGMGYGTEAVNWIKEYIFRLPDRKIRIEAYTRYDNVPMRKALTKCGFVKEGYLRDAWENDDGSLMDAMIYAITRSDWEHGITTPIKLDAETF
ncbi:GNAT family N-acetyltransferase [Bacillus andreraoultii]|uniref:GNAT family N-acetyltransferase n=1 Tax=Bacillus andreraoultii TaxID=1499685 RepID=UPI00053AF7BB|nr:GNAT family protein [Bacillus andreraoultii]